MPDQAPKRSAFVLAFCATGLLVIYPLLSMVMFALAKIIVWAWAVSSLPGVTTLRGMPGFNKVEFVQTPGTDSRWGTRVYLYASSPSMMARAYFRDLWDVLTLSSGVAGETRKQTFEFVAIGYLVAVLLVLGALTIGMVVGLWLSRWLLRPSYFDRPCIASIRHRIYRASAIRGMLWAYPCCTLFSLIYVLFISAATPGFALDITPPIKLAVVLLCLPCLTTMLATTRCYRRIVSSKVGANDYLCDCDYECPPESVCPECGRRTNGLPARLRWRWMVKTPR